MNIQDLVQKIESDKYSEKQLINLYNNANNKKDLSEEDKEILVEAIENNTRLRFPRAAKRIFGAKESVANTILEKLHQTLSQSQSINFTSNKLKNGVKTGGRMISGEFYIDVYMSFKNSENQGAYISLTQKTIDDELIVTVGRYSTHNPDSGVKNESKGGIDSFEDYAIIYQNHLGELIN
ncbi:hypothetical protein [Thalassotalea castellviae]|uniref:Uncharacterized protein n=1 Tax=Thalassotalea castellviae TaxID=3075612 RepID=A0ABU3A589_9GAMM|nr:hypothetical protein [Thalassotalea sp. W431]MDT0605043.1 hypothetical protein [Thalassotalea sp. W431]